MTLTWCKRFLIAGLLACSTVGVANAQPGRGQGGPGGGFGVGFGGGRGGGSSLHSLADNEAVQKELGISDDAKAAVKKVNEAYREELQKAIEEATKSVNAKMAPQVKEALSAEQFKRLQQIRVQALRDQAYSDPEVVKALGLKKEQQDKIAEIGREFADKQRNLFSGGGDGGRPDLTAIRSKMDELNKERESKINQVLTKEQQDKLKSLKGEEFDLASLQPRFGGPGGGGPGGGAAGGGRQGGRPSSESGRPKTAPPVVD